jgi:phosphoribosylformimino-5-aminoimidazole carboxamide ribotide isomerase
MDIIPVIDLKGGAVVHARGGRRDEYRPIETPLSSSSAPTDVIAGLQTLYPFETLYIADLDAIEGTGDNIELIEAVLESQDVWLDSGLPPNRQAAATMSLLGRGSVVIGSESRPDRDLLLELRDSSQVVLSLDFRRDEFQ